MAVIRTVAEDQALRRRILGPDRFTLAQANAAAGEQYFTRSERARFAQTRQLTRAGTLSVLGLPPEMQVQLQPPAPPEPPEEILPIRTVAGRLTPAGLPGAGVQRLGPMTYPYVIEEVYLASTTSDLLAPERTAIDVRVLSSSDPTPPPTGWADREGTSIWDLVPPERDPVISYASSAQRITLNRIVTYYPSVIDVWGRALDGNSRDVGVWIRLRPIGARAAREAIIPVVDVRQPPETRAIRDPAQRDRATEKQTRVLEDILSTLQKLPKTPPRAGSGISPQLLRLRIPTAAAAAAPAPAKAATQKERQTRRALEYMTAAEICAPPKRGIGPAGETREEAIDRLAECLKRGPQLHSDLKAKGWTDDDIDIAIRLSAGKQPIRVVPPPSLDEIAVLEKANAYRAAAGLPPTSTSQQEIDMLRALRGGGR